MLANAPICASLPTTDVARAKGFYGTRLGLPQAAIGVEGGVFFNGGGGTMLRLYERPPLRTPAEHTVAAFLVEDLDEAMSELRRGASRSRSTTCRTSRPRTACSPMSGEAYADRG
jgi:predicted enzyme related to lactoylglutathione lyase